MKLEPGDYVIVPSSYYNEKVDFFLRLFTEYKVEYEHYSFLDAYPSHIDLSNEDKHKLFGKKRLKKNRQVAYDELYHFMM